MRRCALGLLFLVVVPAFTTSWAARRGDSSSSAKGSETGSCPGNGNGTIPWVVPATSNPTPLYYPAGTNAGTATYEVSLIQYDWGGTNCPTDNSTPTEQANGNTVLAVSVTKLIESAADVQLRSVKLDALLNDAGLLPCDSQGGIAICNGNPLYFDDPLAMTQVFVNDETFSYTVAQPTAVTGADGTSTMWTFGTAYYNTANGNGPVTIENASDTLSMASAVLVVGGTVAQNKLSTSALQQVTLIDSSQNILVLGAPGPKTTPGSPHNSLPNALSISGKAFTGIFDLSENYPLEKPDGTQQFGQSTTVADYPAPPCLISEEVALDNTGQEIAFRSIWFNYTAQSDSPVTISTAGSHFDTVLTVYAGSLPLSSDLCNDDFSATSVFSQLTFTPAAGQTYHIMVTEAAPPNPSITNPNLPVATPGVDLSHVQITQNLPTFPLQIASATNEEWGSGSVGGGVFPLSADPILYLTLTQSALPATTLSVISGSGQSASYGSKYPGSLTVLAADTDSNPVQGVTVSFSGAGVGLSASSAVTGANGEASVTATAKAVGALTVTATTSGVTTPATFKLTGTKAAQTITFEAIPTQHTGTSLSLTASATSGLGVSFTSLTTSVCTVSEKTAKLHKAGTCTIEASQAGNSDYAAAPKVSRSFTVSAANFTITPDPAEETVKPGAISPFKLELKSESGFDADVKLSCEGGPHGFECSDFPKTVKVDGKTYANPGILFPKSAEPGTYKITFIGVSGSITHTATAKFTIK